MYGAASSRPVQSSGVGDWYEIGVALGLGLAAGLLLAGVLAGWRHGLVVPVVRGCESLSVDAIAAEVGRLAHEARDGRLTADELRDSTFTVTSAGKLGGVFVTPLVNHPEVAILGLHRAVERPVVRAGQVVVRRVGNVSVSFDHRVVDGARAAAFCLDVIERLQSGQPPGA